MGMMGIVSIEEAKARRQKAARWKISLNTQHLTPLSLSLFT
jgi:hypothetical protein